jgi:hypothetical protein
LFVDYALSHTVAELRDKLLTAERFMTGFLAPVCIPRINILARYGATKFAILAEYHNGVRSLLELVHKSLLLGSIGKR